jgi:asparagine synthase (glutamine-hydrolysing)
MCGIAGLIRYANASPLQRKMICQMTDQIKHRGPDDEGFLLISQDLEKAVAFGDTDTPAEVYENLFPYTPTRNSDNFSKNFPEKQISILLGHRRLSILDLSAAGHQPMCLEERKLWISYNGEIFNFVEIRQELEGLGHLFISQSDTEVILRAYKQWGSACLHKFNGMFGFVIIDLDTKKIFIARDRFGVKPVYLWESSSGFLAIASEIKEFTTLPGWKAKGNIKMIYDYLSIGQTDFSSETMFEDVVELRGGQYIECNLPLTGMPKPKTWYELKKNTSTLSYSQAVEGFYDLFEDAVRLRLRADVDIGSCLSGGLDSSSIVCMANRFLKLDPMPVRQKTFSACSHVPRFNERKFMDDIILQTGVDAHFITPSADHIFDLVKEVVWHQDLPFGSTSIFAQNLVFSLAKKAKIKVMLDGQGSDEKLAGYPQFWGAHFGQLFKNFQWWKLYEEVIAAKNINTMPSIFPLLLKQLLPRNLKGNIKRLIGPLDASLNWINTRDFLELSNRMNEAEDFIGIDHMVDQLSHQQLTRTSLPALLRYEDRNSMAHSVEARTPFVDYRLVEFVFNLPAHFKISEGNTKKVMRDAMKGILPETIRTRRDKLGFATAEEVWMCIERPAQFKKEISEAIDKSQGLLNNKTSIMADQMLSGKIPFNWVLWRIINLGHWIEIFNVKV